MQIIRNYSLSKFRFLAVLFASLVLWGCDQGLTETEPVQQGAPQTSAAASDVVPEVVPEGIVSAASANRQANLSAQQEATNRQLEVVAQALAEEELRGYVYERAMERFDGDTNVLWQDLVNPEAGQQDVPGKKGWNALIKDALPPDRARGMAHKLENMIERAGRLMAGPVHLYWAHAANFENSYEASELRTPLVTFTPLGINFDQNRDLLAFDAQGGTRVVNEKTMKKRPIVVLTGNERTDDQGNVLELFQTSTAQSQVGTNAVEEPCYDDPNQFEDTCDGGGGGTGGGGGGDSDPYTRDIADREPGDEQILYHSRVHEDTEGGSKGLPEVVVALRDEGGNFVKDGYGDNDGDFYFDHHPDAPNWTSTDDPWNRSLFNWEPTEEGFYVTFDWHEDDGDSAYDDEYGSATVNYADPSTEHYVSYHNSEKRMEWTLRWE